MSALFCSYIRREQEYRSTIDDMNNEIAVRSSDPFNLKKQPVNPSDESSAEHDKRMNLKPKHGDDVNNTYK